MENFFRSITILHIVAGTLALFAGPVAMMKQDGSKLHRKAGLIYLRSMQVIIITALILSIYKDNMFLLMISAFTFYLVMTGYRALKLKKLHLDQRPEIYDWIILTISGISGLLLGGWGIFKVVNSNSFGIVAIVFGFTMLRGVYNDFKRFTVKPKIKNHWLFVHIGNMMGAYIATITAFLVQNVQIQPAFIVWLAPTVFIVPFLIYTIRKFQDRSVKNNLQLKLKE